MQIEVNALHPEPRKIQRAVAALQQGEVIVYPTDTVYAIGCGMGHKTITGGLMPGGRLRMEKLAALLQYGRLDTAPLLTHRLSGFESLETALLLMKDKPKELIKPVVLL